MAVEQIKNSQLRLTFYDGYDEEKEQDVYVRKSFNNVNVFATAEASLTAANALATLQTLPLESVERANVVGIQ